MLSMCLRVKAPVLSNIPSFCRKGASVRLLAGAAALLGILVPISEAFADPYLLVPQDKINLRVVEWRSGEGEYKSWEPLNGTFVINQSGAVSIPVVGEVAAAGLATDTLAQRIAIVLQQRAGLPNKPFISVEVAQYGPIYLVGGVAAPGQYQYNPDLTVMKAISLAGGFERAGQNDRARINRDRIQSTGTLGEAQVDYNSLLMREARLRAEMAGKDNFDIPPQLVSSDGAGEIHAEELNLMKFRRVELDSKIAAAQDLNILYTSSIETLQNKIQTQQRQVSLYEKQLATVATLVDKGLTVSSRQFELDQAQSDAESKLLDLEFQLVQSRQSLEESKRDAATTVNAMNSEVQGELSTTIRDIAKADLQRKVSQALVTVADGEAAAQGAVAADNRSQPRFMISRQDDKGETERFEATADTPVKPRDLIEVVVDDNTQ